MNKTRLLALAWLLCIHALKAQSPEPIGASNLVPKPKACTELPGFFHLSPGTQIAAPAAFADAANLLAQELRLPAPTFKPRAAKTAGIVFQKAAAADNMPPAGYKLDISPSRISITAATTLGAIHGLFSLRQLQLLQPDMQQIPCASISDAPRFPYRGVHLDVSRHFFPVDFIKKYLDLLALYKFNTFHWHLTDGPGWRLEIKKYPLLTQQAAFRTHADWKSWWRSERRYVSAGSPNAYGGYYTQAEAREVVAYAAARGITVIPEIEMPGHSEEVLAVYPELACSGQPYKNGEFCIGNEASFEFLENVLTEVVQMFPSTYIHIGGDEAGSSAWKNCPKCQQRKADNGLKTEHELQAYLVRRMEAFLKKQGRKLIGWDEIIEGGLPPEATVMSWRGEKGGIAAAKAGHDVVMTPGNCYLDTYQSDPVTQPEAIGGFLPIANVYAYEPVPTALDEQQAKHILGAQACVWTEYMPSTYQVEYMAFPRALALAELVWTEKKQRNFPDFQRRLQAQYRLLQRKSVNYYRPSSNIEISAAPDYNRQQNRIELKSEYYQPVIRYTTDGSPPGLMSTRYEAPFFVVGKTTITAAIFNNDQVQGAPSVFTANYHKAIEKKVLYNNRWSDAYPAQQERTLTNGVTGSLSYHDQQWLGYLKDLDVTLDMEAVQPIEQVSLRFMHQPGPGVHLPAFVEIQLSDDGLNFSTVEKITHDIRPDNPQIQFKTFQATLQNKQARYIRIVAPNIQGGFMFVDEVVVW